MGRLLRGTQRQPIPEEPPNEDQVPEDEAHLILASALARFPELFDAESYCSQLDEIPQTDFDPLDHFMRHGRALNLAPGPWIDPDWYWACNPDVAKVGQAAVDHYALHGEKEGRVPHPSFLPRLSLLTFPFEFSALELTASAWRKHDVQGDIMDPEWLIDELRGAEASEPQLGSITKPRLVRAIPGTHANWMSACVDRVLDALVEDSFLILVPHFMLGGADRVAANIATVAAEILGPQKVCVISTDRGDSASIAWFPKGVTVRRMQVTEENEMVDAEGSRMLAELLMNTRPRTVLNINSRAAWLAFRDYGRTLRESMTLTATQFCRDQFPEGGQGGYGDDYLRDTIEVLDMVILDNERFKQDLVHDLGLLPRDAAKMHVLYQPSSSGLRSDPMQLRRPDRVLWISRLVDQKRPDLVAEIAQLLPELTFEMYGGPVTSKTVSKYKLDLPNIKLHGPIPSIEALTATDFGALLFTSAYEGLPNVPIELGAWGMPIVASRVGGLAELVDDNTGWLIDPDASALTYAQSLREALDPQLGLTRGRALQQRVGTRHSWERFKGEVQALGLLEQRS